ncbi:copper resistance protein NlpE [Weeksellaceae bacterium KMM 9713]|uniref:Copper resistance protein NlpE n=1 Tax=Profundicola chukchiensis TaxID=2961959 RepID=A0A9X4RTQ2_9FLAO|nr:copper resistance protein NlpE [Profundicola chukchiensis]MDG4944836.1 copper resistance protein NlpE [Profundicola chukchiensis]
MKNILLTMGLLLLMVSCSKESNKVVVVDRFSANQVSQIDLERHNAERILNWVGTYYGILPCASCPGIETTLELKPDQTFELKTIYQDTDKKPIIERGNFDWHKIGNQVTLKNNDDLQFKIEKDQVRFLKNDGKAVTGNIGKAYILKRKK